MCISQPIKEECSRIKIRNRVKITELSRLKERIKGLKLRIE